MVFPDKPGLMRVPFTSLPCLYFILLAVSSVTLLLAGSHQTTELRFAPSEFERVSVPTSAPEYQVSFVQPAGGALSVHAGTITQLDNAEQLAAWFGGAREGAKDVNIYCSRRLKQSQEWTPPTIVASRDQTTRDLNRYIKKLGNPVLYTDANGRVWL